MLLGKGHINHKLKLVWAVVARRMPARRGRMYIRNGNWPLLAWALVRHWMLDNAYPYLQWRSEFQFRSRFERLLERCNKALESENIQTDNTKQPAGPLENSMDENGCSTAKQKGLHPIHGVRTVAFSPDSTLVASPSGDGIVRLWDTAIGAARHTLKGHSGRVFAVAFSPDGKLAASASHDNTVRLWDLGTGREHY